MGRRQRVEIQGATCHIFNRGNRHAAVYCSPEEYEAYVDDLRLLSREHGVSVLGYCLMPNHPHLGLRPDGDPLSVFMHRLNLRHAKRFNRIHGLTGRLNGGPYCVRFIESDHALLNLIRSIHRNPVRAGLVQDPDDWPYSSHKAYATGAIRWIDTEDVLDKAGGSEGYRQLIYEGADVEQLEAVLAENRDRLPCETSERVLRRRGMRQYGPWSRLRPSIAVRAALGEILSLLGLDASAVAFREGARNADARLARARVALELQRRGFSLHDIAQALAISSDWASDLVCLARASAPDELAVAV